MKFFAKPATLFVLIALISSGLAWYVFDHFDDLEIPDWVTNHLELAAYLPFAALFSIAITLALLRIDWRIPFLHVALICVLFNAGISLGMEAAIAGLGLFARLQKHGIYAALAGLTGAVVQAAVQYSALALLAPTTRSRRFILRWSVWIIAPYTAIVWLFTVLLDDEFVGIFVACGITGVMAGTAMIHGLTVRQAAPHPVEALSTGLVLPSMDV
jgi:hypothetical protein